jgi:hypothetical protein
MRRFFPPRHINGVGTFQDVGALENDPVIWALSEAMAIFPIKKKLDYIISLGTGEPGLQNYEATTEDCRNTWKNGMFRRGYHLMLERMREKPLRRAYKMVGQLAQTLHRVHRLSVRFETVEPRLDDIESIPSLIAKVRGDADLSTGADDAACCLIATLFYFELDAAPEKYGGKYIATGHISCSVRQCEPEFQALFCNLTKIAARFRIDGWSAPDSIQSASCFGKDGNFRMAVKIKTNGVFSLSLAQGGEKAYDISGSPFNVQDLVTAQGLNASLGREDHGKRKRHYEGISSPKKRRRF